MSTLRKKWLAIAALVAVFLIILTSPAIFQNVFGEWFLAFESFSEEKPILALVLFATLAALSVLLGPFTSAPTVPFAVSAWGEPATVAILLLGWLIGGLGAYALGLWVGEPLVAKIIGKERLESWLQKITPRLDFLTLLLFRLAMPSETGYVFGLLKYPLRLYVAITVLSEIPFALMIAYGSAAVIYSSPLGFAITAIAWILLIAIALRLFVRRTKRT